MVRREQEFRSMVLESGSVMLVVLVATVFVGIVVTAMVRGTGSQSAASIGYSSVHTVRSTLSSGVVATESYFADYIGPEAALEMLDKAREAAAAGNKYQPYLYGRENGRAELAGNQFLSCKMADFESNSFMSRFDIGGARTADGRDLGRASAFYRMGNIKIESASEYSGKNALYMKGGLVNGDNGMEVFGSATFEGFAKFQNSPGLFHGEAFFNGDAEFMHAKNKFYGKAYIGGSAVFQNMNDANHVLFEDDVGFNSNLSTGNSGTLVFKGNVHVGGDFKSRYGGIESNVNLKGVSAGKNFYFSDKMTVYNPAPFGEAPKPHHCVPNQWACVLHSGGHVDLSKVTGFAQRIEQKGMSSGSILSSLGMGAVETRRDPQLDISKIDESLIQSAFSASTNYSSFSVKKLHDSYDKAKADGKLYNDHLVLRVKKGDSNINFNEPHDAKFDRKVIFIVEDGATLNPGGRFYHGSDNSSTMIYAGRGNAKLEQFGSGGLFRGLIYVDSLNTAGNSFNWKAGSSVSGAVHVFSDNDFRWNTGSNNPLKITYNEAALKDFGTLVKGGAGGGKESVAFVDETDRRVRLEAAGFYYY
ncbi:MAG: hypothetical protein FWB94_06510 [Chitinispirillia bacterium]|nr:hypothetical protein [Chitinispirillia bacterium]